jgi:hypothetical protein
VTRKDSDFGVSDYRLSEAPSFKSCSQTAIGYGVFSEEHPPVNYDVLYVTAKRSKPTTVSDIMDWLYKEQLRYKTVVLYRF